MRRHRFLEAACLLAVAFVLSACGAGMRQTSAASDEDTGHIQAAQTPVVDPLSYTTQAGDTLMRVAARPEIYGDPGLWPLLKDANATGLAGKSADSSLDADLVLVVPRDSTPEEIQSARVRAREFAAELKDRARAAAIAARPASAVPAQTPPAGGGHASTTAPLPPPAKQAALPARVPAPAASANRLPLALLGAVLLAALGAVFYVFFRRDRKDFE